MTPQIFYVVCSPENAKNKLTLMSNVFECLNCDDSSNLIEVFDTKDNADHYVKHATKDNLVIVPIEISFF